MACPGWASYESSTKGINSNSRYIIKCIQGFRSKVKIQGDRLKKGCAEGMATERKDLRYQRSRENETTGETKDWLFIYQY